MRCIHRHNRAIPRGIDTGNLIWASPGRDAKTLRKFFRKLKKKGRESIELVSADAANWIGQVVREMCPKAKLCIDPFHVVSWATKHSTKSVAACGASSGRRARATAPKR